jgi:hypothetical protein
LHDIPHTVACRALGVSTAWFYKWRRRPAQPTKREVRRTALEERITSFFRASGDTYGSPRITQDLWAEGWQVSVNTVAEIMADLGLQGRKPPRRRRSLTRQGKRRAAPDLVRRKFDAVAPDVLWVGDMTEIETGEGKFYLMCSVESAQGERQAYQCPDLRRFHRTRILWTATEEHSTESRPSWICSRAACSATRWAPTMMPRWSGRR